MPCFGKLPNIFILPHRRRELKEDARNYRNQYAMTNEAFKHTKLKMTDLQLEHDRSISQVKSLEKSLTRKEIDCMEKISQMQIKQDHRDQKLQERWRTMKAKMANYRSLLDANQEEIQDLNNEIMVLKETNVSNTSVGELTPDIIQTVIKCNDLAEFKQAYKLIKEEEQDHSKNSLSASYNWKDECSTLRAELAEMNYKYDVLMHECIRYIRRGYDLKKDIECLNKKHEEEIQELQMAAHEKEKRLRQEFRRAEKGTNYLWRTGSN